MNRENLDSPRQITGGRIRGDIASSYDTEGSFPIAGGIGVWCGLLGSGFCSISIEGGEFSGPEFSFAGEPVRVFDVFGDSFADPFIGTDSSVFNIYGRNLRFDGEQLRGRLADRSQIRVPVQLFDAAEVRLFDVPEPTTLALTLLGIGLLLGARARGRARTLFSSNSAVVRRNADLRSAARHVANSSRQLRGHAGDGTG